MPDPAISVNFGTPHRYLRPSRELPGEHRWIGKCKKCGEIRRLEGTVMGGDRGFVVVDRDRDVHDTCALGTDPTQVWVRCADHHALLRRVFEGNKRSKHACGARCTHATGPSCDCLCRGANHGSGR